METALHIKTRNVNNIRNNERDIFNYLCTLCLNTSRDMKRRVSNKIRQNAVEYDSPINIQDGDERIKSNIIDYEIYKKSGTEERQDREAGKTIRKMLKKVSYNKRVIGYLRYIFCMSYDEMSTYLEIPVNSVKSELFRLRKTLKELCC